METLNLKQLSDNRAELQTKGDLDAMRDIMHEEFRYVDSSGRQFDKETFLDQFVDPASVQWISQDTVTFDETVSGEIALIQILLEERFILGTNAYEGRFWVLHVYVKENDKWLWQGGQATMINEL
ncbi:nuclear transport factor 2 family protein [Exiguobacterium aurantiacum]|uniref:Nuclear transport factor 2 family protein n=1 Tax=Exiguobacterium aurantiacum TaxID=33987 RepID=A0ABY5FR10_9BACL|nr:nuclear transport factor 2 family protein [Exiguobacterium aurantiacum]UTT43637.1 nuclear transport factor 2 family protein [Exiguobacterium aurantiacum]